MALLIILFEVSTLSIISWLRSKKDIRELYYYHERIMMPYSDRKLDDKDVINLDALKLHIADAYSKGKLKENHYELLNAENSIPYDKIFRKSIDTFKQITKGTHSEHLKKLKEDIKNTHSEQKIAELQFNLLDEKLEETNNQVDNE